MAAMKTKTPKMIDMVVAMYGDFALYGASTSPNATRPGYWLPLRQEHEWFALFYAKVPGDDRLGYDEEDPTLAQALEDHGTGSQWFDDDYDGWKAVAPYIKPKKPFYVSHEYYKNAGAWKREEQS